MSDNLVFGNPREAMLSSAKNVERNARGCLKASEFSLGVSVMLMVYGTCDIILRKRETGGCLFFIGIWMALGSFFWRNIFSARLSAQQASQAFTDDVLETIASL